MIYYSISYVMWILDLVVSSVITCFGYELKNEKLKRWQNIIGLILVQVPFITLKFIYNWNDILRSIGWILTLGASLVWMLIFFKGYVWQKILFVFFRVICCCMAEMLVQFLCQDIILQMGKLNFDNPFIVTYISFVEIAYIIFFLLFMLMWKKFILKKGYDLKIFLIFIIFPISQVVMLSNVNLRILTEFTPAGISMLLGFLIGVVADVLLLILLLRQQSMKEMEIKLDEIEKAWEVEKNHYRDIEMRREELARIRHDLTEQFVVIQELLHQKNYEKATEMLCTLEEYVASTKEYVYCQDPIVNAIMAENDRACIKNGVRFIYNLEIIQPLKINPVAICSIFSNLMRNAIAAASESKKDKDAYISIKAMVKGDYLHIKVDNTYLLDKKKDKKLRKGYGLEILEALAEKYNGQMEKVTEGGIYTVRMLIENIEMNEMRPSL